MKVDVPKEQRPLLGAQTSKPKRACLSVNKGTREARLRRVITQPSRLLSAQVSPMRQTSGRSRRSSPRLGKPATWRRAAGDLITNTSRYARCETPKRYWESSKNVANKVCLRKSLPATVNPDLFLRAHGRIYRNDGALTPVIVPPT